MIRLIILIPTAAAISGVLTLRPLSHPPALNHAPSHTTILYYLYIVLINVWF